ncbi:putative mitochondrial ornithine carrier protein [Sclerotinia borealis F-4128]|uniref:Putative mitochondrial ornithine carrier protein n=1 Tax=Sclerotinia borealis (strain F-4128) TaxID=1432307 RepID=W9CGH3_SCLBF|nr:putative mitochondrial ornithine carrier protein [Sclerotinia borealis F-4128]
MAATITANFNPDVPRKVVSKGREALMNSVEDCLYGSIAGVAGKYIEYPFDTVKVRLQSQPYHLPLQYTGPLDCFKQSIRSDGILGLYRGISAPLVGAALETSSLFFWEQVSREALIKAGVYKSDQPLPLQALWMTGALSGALTSLVLTPIELVKCKIQVPAAANSSVPVAAKTVSAVIREVWHHQGIRGFWNGQLGTLIRETGGCAAWFGSKETVTSLFRTMNAKSSIQTQSPILSTELAPLPVWQQALAGASAGMSYNFLFFPADTIKSRMQTASTSSTAPRTTFMQEGALLWKQHGMRGMYRGCGITVMRSAPSSAFIFMIYDGLKSRFHLS